MHRVCCPSCSSCPALVVEHFVVKKRRLELILVRALENLADSAGGRADAVHERLVVLALPVLGPPLARLVMVLAHGHAQLRGTGTQRERDERRRGMREREG